jgi:hypothetical protein
MAAGGGLVSLAKETLGENEFRTLDNMTSLAWDYHQCDRLLQEQALQTYKKLEGKVHQMLFWLQRDLLNGFLRMRTASRKPLNCKNIYSQ